ncbi:hypothetical protein FVE85_0104 [Porphyridium purpureum]|uniref:Uncharacterized protein n=1 Tax=Porphyridium purpureum TaxID=35688 RepID=A0A5J4YZ24_PORPP|nr:hypothetical protein FVE85_0104 [Porphyridium purpureum]|eukprot:POR1172..scf208_2
MKWGEQGSARHAPVLDARALARLFPRRIDLSTVLLSMCSNLAFVGCAMGTWEQLGHLEHVWTNLLVMVVSLAIGTRYTMPIVFALLQVRGYAIPAELQDLI